VPPHSSKIAETETAPDTPPAQIISSSIQIKRYFEICCGASIAQFGFLLHSRDKARVKNDMLY
jgi:hypothetical protein